MTEKEKMLRKELYNANYDKELINNRLKVKDLCFKYNNLLPSEVNSRIKTLQEIFNTNKKDMVIEQPFMCDYGYNIKIGNNFYSNHNLLILDAGGVVIGDNVFIGPNTSLYTSIHPFDKNIRNKGLETAKQITIGNDVWIGGSVTILPGVSIGDNCVIGAGSIVTKDIPSNSLAYGNPCQVKKTL